MTRNRKNKVNPSEKNLLFGIIFGTLCTILGILISESQYHPPDPWQIVKLLTQFIFTVGLISLIEIVTICALMCAYIIITQPSDYQPSLRGEVIIRSIVLVSLSLGTFITLVDNPYNSLIYFLSIFIFDKLLENIKILIFFVVFFYVCQWCYHISLIIHRRMKKIYIPDNKGNKLECIIDRDNIKKGEYYFTCKQNHCVKFQAFVNWFIKGKREQKCLFCYDQLFLGKN